MSRFILQSVSCRQWHLLSKISARCITECKPFHTKSYRLGLLRLQAYIRLPQTTCNKKFVPPVLSCSSACLPFLHSKHIIIHGIHTTAACSKKKRNRKQQVRIDESEDEGAEKDIDDFYIDQLLDEEDDLSDAVATHPIHGHRVFVLQPDVKWGPKKQLHTNAKLQFEESISLVQTVQDWEVVDGQIYSSKNIDKKRLFGKGTFETITERLKNIRDITAVFVSVEKLTAMQHKELEETWHLEVFDRYL